MMHHEFEKLIGNPIEFETYRKIELVYMWHPAISNVDGKKQIAMLYQTFGMSIIEDMLPRAMKHEKFDAKIREIKKRRGYLRDCLGTNEENIRTMHAEACKAIQGCDYAILADIAEGLRGLDEMRKNMLEEIAELDARIAEIQNEIAA